MVKYSLQDKSSIEKFVSENSLDVFSTENEEKWQELGNMMNRNWEEVRESYRNWKIQNSQTAQTESARELEVNVPSDYQNLDYVIEQLLSAANEVDNCDVIEYVVHENGQLIEPEELNYIVDLPMPQQASTSQIIPSGSEKRPREILEYESNPDFLKIFEKQSLQELELKRQEHQERMMIYRQQLAQGAELHKERMKILRAKLRAIEEKVEDIDNTICNRNLKKKFKSDSI